MRRIIGVCTVAAVATIIGFGLTSGAGAQTTSSTSSSTTTTAAHPTLGGDPTATTAATSAASPSTVAGVRIVGQGDFCTPAGATGQTVAGTPMVCTTTAVDSRLRWRASGTAVNASPSFTG